MRRTAMISTVVCTTVLCGAAKPVAHAWDVTVSNPADTARPDSVVEIPGMAIGLSASSEWSASVDGNPIPTQLLDEDGDGQPDALLISVDLAARQQARVRLDPIVPPAMASPVQAVIGVRRGAAFNGKKWAGGHINKVDRLDLDPSHVAGDRLTLYDGPGWESGRIAFRLYLDQRNALDLFGKKRTAPVLQWIGQGIGDYHKPAQWGMDILHVTDSLGAGGLGVIENGHVRQVGPAASGVSTRRIANGPVSAGVIVDDRGLTADAIRYDLTARYLIDAGSRVTRITASASADAPVVAGIEKRASVNVLRSGRGEWAYIATYGRQSFIGDRLGMAILYRRADASQVGDDGHTVFVRFKNPHQISYSVAAAWAQEDNGISDQRHFKSYLEGLMRNMNAPVLTSAKPVE